MNEADSREARRQRRRKRRAVMIGGFVLLSLGLAWFFESQATTTVLVVRYSEQQDFGFGDDARLSTAGEQRAAELARMLRDVDVVAGVDQIFVASNRRARETAMPLALLNEAPIHEIEDPVDVAEVVERIITEFKGEIILVITDPEYIQPLIAEMHGSKKLPEMAEGEHDNLYIVTIPWFGKVKTLRLRYGTPYLPAI